jgi:hypothetical protein
MAARALWKAKSSMASSMPRAACSRADRSAVSAGVSGPGRGTRPPPKFTIMVVARLARLPRSLARSALRRPTKASSLKLASSPKVISRRRK